ncbi:MAG: acetyl-CoA hydrolase/transferase C-terminal domain-containing protein [Pseudomonadota bacterium]
MSNKLDYEAIVDQAIERVGRRLVVGLPLGLGKPNRLVNAFYERARRDSSIDLEIVTALSLDVPQASHWLEKRLMGPIVERLYGSDYPRLSWIADQRAGRVPRNVTVTEFYVQSGSALGQPLMQQHYISSNYTHVARDLVDRGVNLVLQLVARDEQGRLSLSCNPDVSLDLKRRLDSQPDRDCWLIAQIHPDLPYMPGDAEVDGDFFDQVIDASPEQRLFAIPRLPVSPQDHAVGFHASRLVSDGGTLQIGIGSLSDALVHSLIQRQQDNAGWCERVAESAHRSADIEHHEPFDKGLYGASEMFMDGFMHLYRAGILKRGIVDDIEQMRAINSGEAEAPADSAVMDGGFFLGSSEFYDFLRDLSPAERPRFRMHGVGRINQLYGGLEALEIEQRKGARFINTCMMMTATGAAVSDGLKDHQVISGVGGQYNFVAMAHAMDDGRSILMLRATRGEGEQASSNIVWEYPHVTIPRHLRDIVVTEYGIADLRGRTDEECIQALIGISDARFQGELVEQAKRAGKLDPDWAVPEGRRRNRPDLLAQRFSEAAGFPAYPYGSDFTDTERRLIKALQGLKGLAKSKVRVLKAALRGQPDRFSEDLSRLGLDQPTDFKEKLHARLLAAMLADQSD